MSPQTVICIGRSGSGKGTQIKLLEELLRGQSAITPSIHIETGHYFRAFIEEKNSLSAQLANEYYLAGKRQPEFLAISMWGYVMCKDYTGIEHLMFDGTPRSEPEARIMEDALAFFGRFDESRYVKPKVIFLDVPVEWSVARMSERGRIDDKTKEQIDLRSEWYETEVVGAIEFFKSNPKFDFIHIKGDRTITEVRDDIAIHFK